MPWMPFANAFKRAARADWCAVLMLALAAATAGCGDAPQQAAEPVSEVPPPLDASATFRFDDRLGQAEEIETAPAPGEAAGRWLLGGEKAECWTTNAETASCSVTEDGVRFSTQGKAHFLSPPGLGIAGRATEALLVTMRIRGAQEIALEWRGERQKEFSEDRACWIHAAEQDVQLTYNVALSGFNKWRHAAIGQLRLTIPRAAELVVHQMRLLTRRDLFARQPYGLSDYSLDNLVRPVLYAHCPARLSWRLRLPPHARFRTGLAVTGGQAPVAFSLRVEHDTRVHDIPLATIEDSSRWNSARADLSGFAGQEVSLSLVAGSDSPGTVGLWSNPILAGARQETAEEPASRPRNVVVYVVDALRADHLDVYGYGRETAPNLTALAKQGVLFERCFSQETWTKPSMSSLATGVDALLHGVERFGDLIPDALPMFPEALRAAGYVTGAVSENPHTPPDANQRRAYSHVVAPHLRGEFTLTRDELADITYAAVEGFLERNRAHPFFLYIHTMECHDIRQESPTHFVYDPPARYRYQWASEEDPRPMDLYDATILHMDENLRRVLDKLDALGLREDTLFIFTADHGEAFGEHDNRWGHFGKPYNELVRIPLVAQWPAGIAPGAVAGQNVQLIDLPPTILGVLQLEGYPSFQGSSLEPLWQGRAPAYFDKRVVHSNWANRVSTVRGPWKLMDNGPQGKELYNLDEDMPETRNLAEAQPEVFQRLDAIGTAYVAAQAKRRAAVQAEQGAAVVSIDPRTREALDAMGYLD